MKHSKKLIAVVAAIIALLFALFKQKHHEHIAAEDAGKTTLDVVVVEASPSDASVDAHIDASIHDADKHDAHEAGK